MPQEIERKFLVPDPSFLRGHQGLHCRQGYIRTHNQTAVRVRVMGDDGYLTLKGPRRGLARAEYEYSIPAAHAHEMLDALCDPPLIEKTRYRLPCGADVWEVDVFAGANRGLVVAEIELRAADQKINPPPWVGTEVTDDPRYLNYNLARAPYGEWGP